MKAKNLYAGLAMCALLAAANADASGFYLGDFEDGVASDDTVSHSGTSPFTDYLNFKVADATALQGTFEDNESAWGAWSLLNLDDLDVDLWSGTSATPGGKLADLGAGDDISFNTGVLAAGSYFFKVTGTPTGFLGGVYEYHVSAVPEPGEWMMLMAGIGLLGLMARRREEPGV